jgi:lipopolysaccharide export system permease protein
MKALGVSIYRALAPVFVAAVVLSGFIVLDQEWLIPEAEAARRRLVIRKRKLIRPELISDSKRGLVIQMDGYDPVAKRMENVRVAVFSLDPDHHRVFNREKGAITARTGERDETTDPPRWILRDWKVEEYDDRGEYATESGKLTGRRSGSEGLALETNVGPQDIESHDLDIYYLTFSDLNRLYHRQKLPHLRVKLHSRISYPVANLILLFLGLPFFLSEANRSLFIGSGICALIGFSYFFVSFLFISMGNSGTIPPMTAAWMPSIFFACLGITLFDRVRS